MNQLGILTPGLGAVSTTFWAGVLLARHGLAEPIGSLTQLDELGRRLGDQLAPLNQLSFGAWDADPANARDAAARSNVLTTEHMAAIGDELAAIAPMPAVFDPAWVPNLTDVSNVKSDGTKMDQAEALIGDIEAFPTERKVMVWCGSTEVYRSPERVHLSLTDFERGLKESDPALSPSQIYAYAALRSGVPFANGAPNVAAEVPALIELAEREQVPLAGKDFKTGQTLLKTIVAPGLKARKLGINGWFSTNILGNRDGLVLDHPESFRSKEITKLGVLESILEPEAHPALYGDMDHEVRINYYPPKGDDKEGWDNIDLFGWLGYPMQLKINFLCRDSILAAPLVLDLALLLDVASRHGEGGVQDWLSVFFKSPHTASGAQPVHDLFEQMTLLSNKVDEFAGIAV